MHEDGEILTIGLVKALRRAYSDADETTYPHPLMMPGLVKNHYHPGLAPLQPGAPDYALAPWTAARLSMRNVDPFLDTLYSSFEMISFGITTGQHIQGWATGNCE